MTMKQAEIIARDEATAHPRVYSFEFDSEPEFIYADDESNHYMSRTVHIMRGMMNGVLAYKIWKRFSGVETTIDIAYYCADPDVAGVKRFVTSVLDDFFAA